MLRTFFFVKEWEVRILRESPDWDSIHFAKGFFYFDKSHYTKRYDAILSLSFSSICSRATLQTRLGYNVLHRHIHSNLTVRALPLDLIHVALRKARTIHCHGSFCTACWNQYWYFGHRHWILRWKYLYCGTWMSTLICPLSVQKDYVLISWANTLPRKYNYSISTFYFNNPAPTPLEVTVQFRPLVFSKTLITQNFRFRSIRLSNFSLVHYQ